jgi:hypothetical protein
MSALRRLIIVLHRYLGIPLSVLFVLWFVTGIAMIYVGGMPELTPRARLAHLPPLDLRAVRLAPADAARAASLASAGDGAGVTLTSVEARPAYRFDAAPFGTTTVFADDGTELEPLDAAASRLVAARFLGLPEAAVEHVATLDRVDQWTLLLRGELPLEKFAARDAAHSEVYVSPQRGEVVLTTTARSRGLAWIATIPHWFYFTALRTRQPLWYWSVVAASAAGTALAALGLVLGIVQFRKSTPFSWAKSIRYVGWMRWHYLLGAVFGVFALTWVFSGMLSMEPFAWTNATGLRVDDETFTGGPLELERYAPFDASAWAALARGRTLKEIELKRIGGAPYYFARYTAGDADGARERLHQPYAIDGRGAPDHDLVDARSLSVRTAPFDAEALVGRLAAALPGEPLLEHELLTDYDSYYYSRAREAPLPVLRVKFGDPQRTWFYIDPALGEQVAVIHRFNRLERWLYNGLHSLDFGFWYGRRPLWDIGTIALCLGALTTSVIGFVFGVQRIRLDFKRAARRLRRAIRSAPG